MTSLHVKDYSLVAVALHGTFCSDKIQLYSSETYSAVLLLEHHKNVCKILYFRGNFWVACASACSSEATLSVLVVQGYKSLLVLLVHLPEKQHSVHQQHRYIKRLHVGVWGEGKHISGRMKQRVDIYLNLIERWLTFDRRRASSIVSVVIGYFARGLQNIEKKW